MSCTDCASNEILYVANGVLGQPYTFPFVYLTEDDVYVALYNFTTKRWDNVPQSDPTYPWKFQNATTIQFTTTAPPPPPSTDPLYPNIKIARCTDIDPLSATFYPGSAIRAQDLNNNFEQLQMAIQEGRCKVPDWLFDYLDKYYWNKLDETLKSGDAWISDDAHIATTAAGDARWLNATGGDVVGGAGIGVTEAGGNVTIAVDLHTTTPGLELDPAGNTGQLRVIGNSVNNQANPVLTDGPSNITFQGGNGVTITGSGGNTVTIDAVAGSGGLTFRGTVNPNNAPTAAILNAAGGDAWTVDTEALDADVNAGWDTLLVNWDSGDGNIVVGDIIACTTDDDQGGTVAERAGDFSLIPIAARFGTLQQVTTNGNTTTNPIAGPNGSEGNPSYTFDGDENTGIFRPAADTVGVAVNAQERFRVEAGGIRVLDDAGTALHQLNANASAVFNENGADADFRVESDGNANMLFVDGGENRVGIGTNTPASTLHVSGRTQFDDQFTLRSGGNAVFNNAGNTQSVSINADDVTATYNLTLPPAAPAAGTRYLRAAGTDTGANQELEWADAGGGDITVQDEGSALATAATTLNFVGAGVTASGAGATKTITIPGGGGGGNTINYNGAAAWGSVTADASSFKGLNIASVVKSGSKYVVTFTNPMPNTDYAVTGSADITSNNFYFEVNNANKTVNGFEYWMVGPDNATGVGNSAAYFAVFALNALPPMGGTGTDAWGNVDRPDDATATLNGSFNCTVSTTVQPDGTVVAAATGVSYVTFTTAMPNANYSVTTGLANTGRFAGITNKTAQGFTVNTRDAAGTAFNLDYQFSVNATNAVLPDTITQEQLDAIFAGRAYNGVAAWGNVEADGTLAGGLNCTSSQTVKPDGTVVAKAAGKYYVTFQTPMPNANYSVSSSGYYDTYTWDLTVNGFSASTAISSSGNTDATWGFSVFALNAAPPKGGTGTDAWGSFDENGTMEASFNATVSRTGVGIYDVVFNTPMPDNTYSINTTASSGFAYWSLKTANGFRVNTSNSAFVPGDFTGADFAVNATNAQLPNTITEDQIAALIQNPVLSAWGDVASDGTFNNGFNITSVTRTATGRYDVVFTNEMPNADYSLVGSTDEGVGDASSIRLVIFDNKTTTGFSVITKNSGSFEDYPFDFQVAGTARNGTLGGGADAWGVISASDTFVNGFNSQFTNAGPGQHQITFDNPMPNGNYAVTTSPAGGTVFVRVYDKTATGFRIGTRNQSDAWTASGCQYAVFATDGNAGGFWVKNGDELSPTNTNGNVKVVVDSDGSPALTVYQGSDLRIGLYGNGSARFGGTTADTTSILGKDGGAIFKGAVIAPGSVINIQQTYDAGGSTTSSTMTKINADYIRYNPVSADSTIYWSVTSGAQTSNLDGYNTYGLAQVNANSNISTNKSFSAPSSAGGTAWQGTYAEQGSFVNSDINQKLFFINALSQVAGAVSSVFVQYQNWTIIEVQN
jgi:hypothetical protein